MPACDYFITSIEVRDYSGPATRALNGLLRSAEDDPELNPTASALNRARSVADMLDGWRGVQAHIGRVLGGGLQFEFHRRPPLYDSHRNLEIEILPDGTVEVLVSQGEWADAARIPNELLPDMLPYLARWLMG